ncbi:MAG: hypothetical protein IT555_14485 [Acetobacteraceae bacterium]|nr:hypothetical protein [Acetobacteraceae bacterium]
MNTPSPATATAIEAIAARLDAILASLLVVIGHGWGVLGLFAQPLVTRIGRARQRLARLLTSLAAGQAPRRHAPGPSRTGATPPIQLPRRRAWLVATLGYQAAAFASQLQHLLADPATQAALAEAAAAAPAITRTLRPLCRLLGVDLPPALRLPPRPPRPRSAKPPRPKPPPPKPPPPKPPPMRPLYPQSRPRPMPFLRPPAKIRDA